MQFRTADPFLNISVLKTTFFLIEDVVNNLTISPCGKPSFFSTKLSTTTIQHFQGFEPLSHKKICYYYDY